MVISVIVLLVLATPFGLIGVIPAIIIYWKIQSFFRQSSREIQRINSISNSPIFSHFSESLNGVSTIRALKLQNLFATISMEKIDDNSRAYIPFITSNRWLGLRLGFVGVLLTASGAAAGVISKQFGMGSAVLFGLALTYVIPITDALSWMVRMMAEVEARLTSVERLKQYTQIEQEAPAILQVHEPPARWPANVRC
jgi:ABC-type multidrug transport system fused ATPase/permease subunit